MARHPSLLDPPVGFAHRGGRSPAPEASLEACALALRLGATGISCEAWRTADGVVVLHPERTVGGRIRRRAIADLERAALPDGVLALADLYDACGTGFDLVLDVADDATAVAAAVVAADAGADATARLWLRHHDHEALGRWRQALRGVRLVHQGTLDRLRGGPERHASVLATLRVDAVELPRADWTGGLTTLFHRFDRLTVARGCTLERHLREALEAGVDAVVGDHADQIADALAQA